MRLSILGLGLELPPSVAVLDFVASKGVDVSFYKGWARACHVRNDGDHPSTMGGKALAQAMQQSGITPQDIRLVIFTGISRDYLPSWSVATEIMRLNGISENCVGLDLTVGCLATLCALDLVRGWLALRGGGHAAIVAAERWSHTIDHSNPELAGIWAYGDGAAAMVVGMNAGRRSIADFLGAEFTSYSDYNGHVLIPYGGTRVPVAPPGVDPHGRQVNGRPRLEVRATYTRNYQSTYAAITRRLGLKAGRLICNQMSPQIIETISEALGISMDRIVVTGHEFGHLGACDPIVGLKRLQQLNQIDAPIAIGSSTAYAFGAGLLVPPPS